MFMTDKEVYQLTGYKLPHFQIQWLRSNGIKFLVGADQRPRVSRKAIEDMLGGSVPQRRKEPNFEALAHG